MKRLFEQRWHLLFVSNCFVPDDVGNLNVIRAVPIEIQISRKLCGLIIRQRQNFSQRRCAILSNKTISLGERYILKLF